MDDKQVTENPVGAEEMTEITEEPAAEATEEPAETEMTIAAALKAIADENGGVFPEDTEKAALRFSEIAPGLAREGRLLDVFLACGGSVDLLAVKETAEKEQATFDFYDYSIDKVEIAADGTYKVTYTQKYKKSYSEGSKSTEASSTDTVIEKNGRFYIVGYDEIYQKDLTDTTNKLNDSNYQN